MFPEQFGIPAADEIHAELEEGRAAWLALAVDTCRISKPVAGKGTIDPVDKFRRIPPTAEVVYEGPCLLQIRADVNSNVVETTAGEREWSYQTAILSIPISLPPGATGDPAAVRIDYVVDYLTAAEDPALVGRRFYVKATLEKTRATARRLRVTETVG